MAFFGNLGSPMLIPGYGGGMFPAQGGIPGLSMPNMSAGIDSALTQNAAMGAAKPKKGFGEFLRMFAGTLGDNLTGNPVYSQMQQHMAEQQQMEEMYERKRADEMADWKQKQDYEASLKGPEMPGLAKEVNWINSLPEEDRAKAMRIIQTLRPGNFVTPTPIVMGPGDVFDPNGSSSDVTATNPQTGQKVRYNPRNGQWEAVGGPSQNGSGGFPRPY